MKNKGRKHKSGNGPIANGPIANGNCKGALTGITRSIEQMDEKEVEQKGTRLFQVTN